MEEFHVKSTTRKKKIWHTHLFCALMKKSPPLLLLKSLPSFDTFLYFLVSCDDSWNYGRRREGRVLWQKVWTPKIIGTPLHICVDNGRVHLVLDSLFSRVPLTPAPSDGFWRYVGVEVESSWRLFHTQFFPYRSIYSLWKTRDVAWDVLRQTLFLLPKLLILTRHNLWDQRRKSPSAPKLPHMQFLCGDLLITAWGIWDAKSWHPLEMVSAPSFLFKGGVLYQLWHSILGWV